MKKPSSAEDNSKFISVAAAISALGGMLFGYDTGVISGAILFIQREFSLSAFAIETLVSSALVGAVVGACLGGTIADELGRRKSLLIIASTFTVGAVLSALAPTLAWLVAGRLIVGVAIGASSFTAPLYISEISPVNIRGRLVSFNQIAITIGIVLAYLVDYALARASEWRWMLGLAVLPSLALGIGMYLMPESPRWLIGKGLAQRGEAVLRRIRGKADVSEEMKQIHSVLSQREGKWRDMLGARIRPALVVGAALAVLQQITGINTVIYYAPVIFQSVGFNSASAAILATLGIGIANVLMTLVALRLLDRVGRRPLLLVSVAGMTLSLTALGAAFRFLSGRELGSVAAVSLVIYVGSFAIGLGPVFWLLISEIFPLQLRGKAMSVASVANWGANLVVALTFLSLIGSLGRPLTFWLYGGLSLVTLIFAYKWVPETKGRSLEAIQAEWKTH